MNDNVVGTVCVPAVGVLRGVLAHTATEDVDVVEDNVARVGNKRVPLRAVSELQIRDHGTLCTNETEENGSQDVNILGIEVVPCLTVAV